MLYQTVDLKNTNHLYILIHLGLKFQKPSFLIMLHEAITKLSIYEYIDKRNKAYKKSFLKYMYYNKIVLIIVHFHYSHRMNKQTQIIRVLYILIVG